MVVSSSGVERNQYHMGFFRAMSVLRTARLLAITPGTTVSNTVYPSNGFGQTRRCTDDYAISEDCSATSRQRFLSCVMRDDPLLVSLFSIPRHEPSLLSVSVALSAFNRLRVPSAAHVTSSLHWAKTTLRSTRIVAGTSIQQRCKRWATSMRMGRMLHPKDSFVHSDKFAWYVLIACSVTPSHREEHV